MRSIQDQQLVACVATLRAPLTMGQWQATRDEQARRTTKALDGQCEREQGWMSSGLEQLREARRT